MRSQLKTYIENLGLLASEQLSQAKFEFIAHGYETGATMRENEIALKRLILSSKKTRFFESVQWGKLRFPIMVAPMAFHSLYNEQFGELAAARACEKTGVPFFMLWHHLILFEFFSKPLPKRMHVAFE